MASQSSHLQSSNTTESDIHFIRQKGTTGPLTVDEAAEQLLRAYKQGSGRSVKEEFEQIIIDPLVMRVDPDKPDLPRKPLLATIKPPLLYAGVAFFCAVGIFFYLFWRS